MTNLLLCALENNGDYNISKLKETLTRIYGPLQLLHNYSTQNENQTKFYLEKGSENYKRVQNGEEIIMYP